MALIAVLSNPASDGNKSRLDRVRAFCDDRRDILHIEVERSEDVGMVLNRVSFARPQILVLNGGDGTVQSVLTEMYGDDAPDRARPPIAVRPNGKTNLIAKDLGAMGDPIRALERILEIAETGVGRHVVGRQLISLDANDGGKPVLGMFLAAGALADILLFCRHKLYPLGLPNGLAHALTVVSGLVSVLTDWSARWLPPKPRHLRIGVGDRLQLSGRFQVLMVTTLRTLVLSGSVPAEKEGTLQLLAIERRRSTGVRAVFAALTGRLGRAPIPGIHLEMGHQIRIEDESDGVIMDGEFFQAARGKPLVLTPTRPVSFVDLSRAAQGEGASGEISLIPQQPAGQAGHKAAIASLLPDPR
jgi:hypothetical protein